jgi:ethanolamine utilization protein EutN
MYLGRVIGTVVATRRIAGLEGRRLMFVEPADELGRPNGLPAEVSVDVAQAGPGDLVFLVGSREAALAVEPSFVPIDSAIVGIVDQLPGGTR